MHLKHPYRYWFLLQQDVDKPIGGVKQIHLFSAALNAAGYESYVIHKEPDYRPSWFPSSASIVGLSEAQHRITSRSSDVIIYPETFVSIASRNWNGFNKILLNQNSHYTFGIKQNYKPQYVSEIYKKEFMHFLCVSRHDARFLVDVMDLSSSTVSRLVNGIDTSVFNMPSKKRRQIAYMPRKNKSDARIVCSLLSSKSWFQGWDIVPIQNLPQSQVASILKESLLYLSFGHPEGFGLPLVEATSCGCGIIGYTGNGGKEIFDDFHTPLSSKIISFNDLGGFITAVRFFIDAFERSPERIVSDLTAASNSCSNSYSFDCMKYSVESALASWTPNLLSQ